MNKKVNKKNYGLMKDLLSKGVSQAQLADLFDFSPATASRVNKFSTYEEYRKDSRERYQPKKEIKVTSNMNQPGKEKGASRGTTDSQRDYQNDSTTQMEALLAILRSQKRIIELLEDVFKDIQLLNLK